jgi:sec-independent protein translocase protein TatC
MAKRLRPIGYEDRLSVVDHLDELRSRLIVCALTLIVAFTACFIFNGHILNALNAPAKHLDKQASNHLSGTTGDEVGERRNFLNAAGELQLLARSSTQSANDRALFAAIGNSIEAGAKSLPSVTAGDDPVTLGVGEPFTTTIKVCFYFALIISLPVLLFELLAFVLPALSEREKAVVRPIVIAGPTLFFAGVIFAYVIVLPAALKFLQGYNSSHFQSLIQAAPLYSFEVLTMAAIGLAFEMPMILLGLRAVGVLDGSTLTTHWRYAAVIIAVVAAAMPGADPVTTGLETAPLVILFLASIVLLKYLDRRAAKRAAAEELASPGATDVS